MTRKEAINRLKTDIYQYTDFSGNPNENEFWEAFDMAIEALEQEPSGDCISRQAVDDAIYDYSRSCDVNYAQIMEFIDKLPSVTPQPKMGRWKRISMDKYSEHAKYWYRCDRCGKDNLGNTNYCPMCGAKMSEIPTGAEGSEE